MKDVLQKPAENYEPRGRLDPTGFSQHVNLKLIPPPADLAPFVEHFWIISWQGIEGIYNSEEVMHRPYVDVFVASGQVGVQGTFRGKRVYQASGTDRIVGVRFLPGVFHTLWSGDMTSLQNKMIDLAKAFPDYHPKLTSTVLALSDEVAIEELAAFVRNLHPEPDLHIALMADIIAGIEADESLRTVGDVTKAVGKSERWLQQLFQEYVGVGLKWLLQRRRLLGVAEEIRKSNNIPNWSAIAYDLGYSSQQHFNADFKKIVSKTPLQYFSQTHS